MSWRWRRQSGYVVGGASAHKALIVVVVPDLPYVFPYPYVLSPHSSEKTYSAGKLLDVRIKIIAVEIGQLVDHRVAGPC